MRAHTCALSGVFNPNSEDPLPGKLKKQLALRIISGQQLPKPRDSVLGDRGEVGAEPTHARRVVGGPRDLVPTLTPRCPQIIDPFVEVEVIGLPVDCSKEQTRVVDDNGEGSGQGWCGHQMPVCIQGCHRPHVGYDGLTQCPVPLWDAP